MADNMPEEIVRDDRENVCFGCSPHNEDGLRLRFVRTRDGGVEASYTAPEKFCGAEGVIHGGIQAAMLDEVLGIAAHVGLADDDLDMVTVDFRLRYRRPAPVGRQVAVRGRFLRMVGRDVYVEGEIVDDGGETLTTAAARWRLVNREPRSGGDS
jgi:uncharacterized protein (TIGR00369 family)